MYQKSVAYAVFAAGFSLTAWMLDYVRQNIQILMTTYRQYFLIYFIVTGVISFAVCYYKGPVTNPRVHDLIRWLIQLIAIGFIFSSSFIPELVLTIFAVIVATSYLLPRLCCPILPDALTRFW